MKKIIFAIALFITPNVYGMQTEGKVYAKKQRTDFVSGLRKNMAYRFIAETKNLYSAAAIRSAMNTCITLCQKKESSVELTPFICPPDESAPSLGKSFGLLFRELCGLQRLHGFLNSESDQIIVLLDEAIAYANAVLAELEQAMQEL